MTATALLPTGSEGTVNLWDRMSVLRCPGCNDQHLHLERLRRVDFEDGYAEPGGDDATGLPMRGGAIILGGRCESGCEVEIAFGQHKGSTFVTARTSRTVWHPSTVAIDEESYR